MSNYKLYLSIDMHFLLCKFLYVKCFKLAKTLSKIHATLYHRSGLAWQEEHISVCYWSTDMSVLLTDTSPGVSAHQTLKAV